ncbi:GVQW3 [Cordylochernes scorpioides]|uniref:GVQW3 n=1 Tax=Cordylochernes scorpioides TaxID=51811 RepID=A0ABY6KMA2_9ARAC|nr:GVQW3 [Cordylochernes scorpioides]
MEQVNSSSSANTAQVEIFDIKLPLLKTHEITSIPHKNVHLEKYSSIVKIEAAWLAFIVLRIKDTSKLHPCRTQARMKKEEGEHVDCIEKQRVCIEFCFKLGKTASDSFQMLKQAFKGDALSQPRTFEWFARFKAGRTSVKDDLHTGRPLSIRNSENALKIKSSIK